MIGKIISHYKILEKPGEGSESIHGSFSIKKFERPEI